MVLLNHGEVRLRFRLLMNVEAERPLRIESNAVPAVE